MKRSMFDDYGRSREALNKRIGRLENAGYVFPADILENKSIDEMNSLGREELKKISEEFMEGIINNEVNDADDIRYGYKHGPTKEEVEDYVDRDDIPEINDSKIDEPEESDYEEVDFGEDYVDYDYYDDDYDESDFYNDYDNDSSAGYDYDDFHDYDSGFSYADEITFDAFLNQFTKYGIVEHIADLVNKFIHKAISKFGMDITRDGIFRGMTEVEFNHKAGYDITFAASYLESILQRIESEYEFQSGFYHHDSASKEMHDLITQFQDAVERQEDWSEIY